MNRTITCSTFLKFCRPNTVSTDDTKNDDKQSSPSSSLKGFLNIGGKKETNADTRTDSKLSHLISPSDFTGQVLKYYA